MEKHPIPEKPYLAPATRAVTIRIHSALLNNSYTPGGGGHYDEESTNDNGDY